MDETIKFSAEEINQEWASLLSQYVMIKINLQKKVAELQLLADENIDLKAQLHQVQLDLMRLQK